MAFGDYGSGPDGWKVFGCGCILWFILFFVLTLIGWGRIVGFLWEKIWSLAKWFFGALWETFPTFCAGVVAVIAIVIITVCTVAIMSMAERLSKRDRKAKQKLCEGKLRAKEYNKLKGSNKR